MLGLLTDVVVNFGIGSLFGNIGTKLVTESGNKVIDKVALGLGTAIVAGMVKDAAKKYVDGKVDDVKDMFKKPEEEVKKDGGEISE